MVLSGDYASAFFEPGSVEAAVRAETEKLNAALDELDRELGAALARMLARGGAGSEGGGGAAAAAAGRADAGPAAAAAPRRGRYNRIPAGMQHYRGTKAVVEQFTASERFREHMLRMHEARGDALPWLHRYRAGAPESGGAPGDPDGGGEPDDDAAQGGMRVGAGGVPAGASADARADHGAAGGRPGSSDRSARGDDDVDDVYSECVDVLAMHLYELAVATMAASRGVS